MYFTNNYFNRNTLWLLEKHYICTSLKSSMACVMKTCIFKIITEKIRCLTDKGRRPGKWRGNKSKVTRHKWIRKVDDERWSSGFWPNYLTNENHITENNPVLNKLLCSNVCSHVETTEQNCSSRHVMERCRVFKLLHALMCANGTSPWWTESFHRCSIS